MNDAPGFAPVTIDAPLAGAWAFRVELDGLGSPYVNLVEFEDGRRVETYCIHVEQVEAMAAALFAGAAAIRARGAPVEG